MEFDGNLDHDSCDSNVSDDAREYLVIILCGNRYSVLCPEVWYMLGEKSGDYGK